MRTPRATSCSVILASALACLSGVMAPNCATHNFFSQGNCASHFVHGATVGQSQRMDIGGAIRRIRLRKGMKQKDLAAALNEYDAGNLSKIERGEQGVSSAFLEKLPAALGVPLSEIFREAEQEGSVASRDQIEHRKPLEQIIANFNTKNLAIAIEAVEMAIPQSRYRLRPEDRAQIIETVYRLVRPDGSLDLEAVAEVIAPVKARQQPKPDGGKSRGGKRHTKRT